MKETYNNDLAIFREHGRSLKSHLFSARYSDIYRAVPRRNYANGNAFSNTRDYTLRDIYGRHVHISSVNTDALCGERKKR